MAKTFVTRTDAADYGRKQPTWPSFRTTKNKDNLWEITSEGVDSPAKEWANGKEFVAWTETDFALGRKVGIVVVSCTKDELDEELEKTPPTGDFIFEPVTESLWETEKPTKARGTPKGGPREKSSVLNPTKLVWKIADDMADKTRKEVIAACVAQGIHPSTAATQFSKWRKKRLAT
jgi:hypothetical protein